MDEAVENNLPPGTIVRRIIRGKERFYHQWRENGKTLSRYLKADEVLPLREKIEKRKAILKRRDEGLASTDGYCLRFSCGVLTGKRLAELAASVRPLKPRSTLEPVVQFLRGPVPGHLLLIEGLPQTGKTTLLRQAIRALDAAERETCAYLSLPGTITPKDLLTDLQMLAERGITRLLVDGLERVPTICKVWAAAEDVFAATGMRIVIAASQPHALELPARTEVVSTTFLPFSDFCIGRDNPTLDDYLRHGGPDMTQIDERSLRTLEAFNRRTLLRVLTDAARRRTAWSARLGNDIQKLVRRLEEFLGEEPSAADIARLRDLGLVATAEDETFLILPGLRHGLSRKLVRELLADDVAAHLGAAERKIVEETILSLVTDRTLADLVLYRMMLTRKNATTDVFRIRFPRGGFDVVVADREELTCELYEVRNATERTDRQLANLTDPDMLDTVEHRYGTIISRTLVYNGRNAWHASGIAYRKAVELQPSSSAYSSPTPSVRKASEIEIKRQ